MQLRFIDGALVRELLPMSACIEAMDRALRTLSEGDAVQPLRSIIAAPDGHAMLGTMPGYLGKDVDLLGIKVVSVVPANRSAGLPSHQGIVMLFEKAHGRPIALIDAESITAVRTAAVSALATRVLARDEAGVLAILGSGAQAASHLEAMRTVRPIREVRVWSRTADNAREFAERARSALGLDVEAVASAEAAVDGAELICTTTAAREPILAGRWLAEGSHINAVGACFPSARELDSEAVACARLIVDWRESTLAESGDFLLAKQEGAIDDDHIAGDLGGVLTGRVVGRRAADEITLFKSLGLAVEDLAAAKLIYERAVADERGVALDIEG